MKYREIIKAAENDVRATSFLGKTYHSASWVVLKSHEHYYCVGTGRLADLLARYNGYHIPVIARFKLEEPDYISARGKPVMIILCGYTKLSKKPIYVIKT